MLAKLLIRAAGGRSHEPRDPRLSELLAGFLIGLRAENRSPATIAWYRARILRLARSCHDPGASSISAGTLRAFLVEVKQGTARPNSDVYVEGHRKAMVGFFAWCVREQFLAASPAGAVRPFKVEIRELPTLSPAEVTRLLDARTSRSFEGQRDRAIMALLFDTGIRVGELVRIRTGDLDLEGGSLRVLGKSRRDRRVPLSKTMRAILWAYLQRWRPRPLFPALENDLLFCSRKGAALREGAVNQLLSKVAAASGIERRRCSPHAWRHTFATEYLRGGGDEFSLQKILGHSTMAMVRRYVHLVFGDLAARHAIASPLERLRPR